MTQVELEREVAEATGETIGTIRRHGFSLVTPLKIFDPDADEQAQQPQVLDWDQVEYHRSRAA